MLKKGFPAVFVLFLTVASFAVATPAHCEDPVVFTKDFAIGSWHLDLSYQTFNSDNSGEGVLTIQKTTPDKQLDGGFVLLNRQLIFLRDFLTGAESEFMKDVELKAENHLTVFLRGTPDASIHLEISIKNIIQPPEVTFTAVPNSIALGDSSTLGWSTKNVDSCTIGPDIGSVDVDGSVKVSPTETTTYTLTATGPGGSLSADETVTVTYPPPEVSIGADKGTIEIGQSTTLSWISNYAASCAIAPGIGSVERNGSMLVSPTETTTYTITAASPGGNTTDSVTVTVNDPNAPPTAKFSATPPEIDQGGSSTLSWTSFNGNVAHIDNGIGAVELNGSIPVSPEHTTTYTITVTGPTGSTNARAVVTVLGNQLPQPEGSFGEQYHDLIPVDATVEEYDYRQFSLITGLVQDLAGAPLSDVSITIHSRPEYGTVTTNAEGRFSIPVEGGGNLTVVYQKNGLITAHRKVYVPWNDIAIAETVQMITEDPVSTTLTFDGNPDTVVIHRSTPVADEFGSRSASMVFTGDNRAFLVDENGDDVQELATIATRATEFITPESMPAKLPPNSAYTFCAELSVDGAQNVRFEKPVITYVDNFLGFDVGMAVPAGYYDRIRGVWVPVDNGVVVKLLDINSDGIVDSLDADGDDLADDLDGNGSFSNEVKGLDDPLKFNPNTTYWRVAVTHFTPWDYNWPIYLPADAQLPNPEGLPNADQQQEDQLDCKMHNNSFVEARSRIYHEDIAIPGTDFTLHYASNRVNGYRSEITVPASGNTVPDSLKRIIVRVEIAGQKFEQVLGPLTNQMGDFEWNGLDNFGLEITGPVKAHTNIGFVYDGFYTRPGSYERAFAQAGGEPLAIRARQDVTLWKAGEVLIDKIIKGTVAEGWTLSNHHQVSLSNASALHKGDGTTIDNNIQIISPASEYDFAMPAGLAADAAGNLYISDSEAEIQRILKIDTDGIITRVAGSFQPGFWGDGGPATSAAVSSPEGLAVDSTGNLYIADSFNQRIRKVDPDGIITTVAGSGQINWDDDWVEGGYGGDGGMATSARLNYPYDVAVDSSGNIYIADTHNCRIRKVDPSGIITTVAGNGISGFSGDNDSAIYAALSYPDGVAVDPYGNLYIADTSNHRIRKVDSNGIITTIAGSGETGYGQGGFSGDGGPATGARLNRPKGLSLDKAGNLYIADSGNRRLRLIDTNGFIRTVAGNGDYGLSDNNVAATDASFHLLSDVSLDPSGRIYILDVRGIWLITTLSSFEGIMTVGEIGFVDRNGLGHLMSISGNHKKTLDLVTGVALHEFGYDENHNLVSIFDRFGNQVRIERQNGIPSAIISADGIRTELTIDENNHLTQIKYPDGSFYRFEYNPDGLMVTEIEPETNRFDHDFDAFGRLTDVYDEEGGHWNYQRAAYGNGNILTQVTSGEGNLTAYLDNTDPIGVYRSTITDPTGAQTLFTRSADGLTVDKSLPCGMDLNLNYGVDSEYLSKYAKEVSESTPYGLERITLRDKIYEDTDSDEDPDLITETVTVNGKTTTLAHNTLAAQKTATSPEGRIVTSLYDPSTLLINSISVPGLYDTAYVYNSRGRMTSVKTNTRQTTFAYNAEGFLDSITDPENHTTIYGYDAVGRINGITRSDNSFLDFTYDANGNMIVLTNPAGIDHEFGHNKVNKNSSYTTPLSGSYSYVYDKDRRLIQKIYPSGKQIKNIYDKTQLKQVQTPEGNIDYTYFCGTKVESISKGAESVTYGYDGKLVTSETLNGTLSQTLGYSYNNDFDLTGSTYAGTTTTFAYDNDGLLTGAGNYTITRIAQNGLPESVAGGSLSLSRTFNGYGEVDTQTSVVDGQSQATWSLNRDSNGRITQKTETVGGVSSDYVYTYDSMGRLLTVTKDSVLVEEYQFDSTGTRSYEMNSLRGIAGRNFTYSDEDHLLTAGTIAYEYDIDGFLTTKTDGSYVTSYSYSSRGELLSVTLPDGRLVEFIHDPLGRRVAKMINGSIVEKYLWQGLTRLMAVYDASDTLLMRFEYADGRMPMAMTSGGSTYYLAYDQVGSLRIVANSVGNVVRRIDYDSFGNVIDDTNPIFAVPFGFAGGLHDRDTGLVRFGYRDYDTDIGRWTAKDPILFLGGDTDLYGYVLNNPINFIDPYGNFAITGPVIAGFIIAKALGVGVAWGGLQIATYAIGDPLAYPDDPCAERDYHVSDLMNDMVGGIATGNATLIFSMAGIGTMAESGAALYPGLMTTAGSPQGQKVLSNAVDIISAAVPSTSPAPNLAGAIGYGIGATPAVHDFFSRR